MACSALVVIMLQQLDLKNANVVFVLALAPITSTHDLASVLMT